MLSPISNVQNTTTLLPFAVNSDETITSYFTWTIALLVHFTVAGPAYELNGFTIGGTALGNPGTNGGGGGLTTLSLGATTLFSGLPGITSTDNYSAAFNKIIKFKTRGKLASQGAGSRYFSFGFVDAATTLDDVETSVAIGLRF